MILRNAILAAGLVAVSNSTPAQDAPLDGKAEFLANCSACHQAQGTGIKGAFPALAGDAFVDGDAPAAAWVVLNGRGGMPAFRSDLSDGQIAAALSYVRSAWGNAAPPVTAAVVAAVRAKEPAARAAGLQAH